MDEAPRSEVINYNVIYTLVVWCIFICIVKNTSSHMSCFHGNLKEGFDTHYVRLIVDNYIAVRIYNLINMTTSPVI